MVKLLDAAMANANDLATRVAGTQDAWMAEDAIVAREQFARIKTQALAGQLPLSHGGGLGISRALGEWAPDDLFAAGRAVEEFYRQNW